MGMHCPRVLVVAQPSERQSIDELRDGRGKGPVGGGVVVREARIAGGIEGPGGDLKEIEAGNTQRSLGFFPLAVAVLLALCFALFGGFFPWVEAVLLDGELMNLLTQGLQRVGGGLALIIGDALFHLLAHPVSLILMDLVGRLLGQGLAGKQTKQGNQ